MSVLDLPLQKQKELASIEGVSHAAWVESTTQALKETKAFRKKMQSAPRDMSPEVSQHLYDKMKSSNPV